MSNKSFGPPGFKINSEGKWECTRCGRTEYVRVNHCFPQDWYFKDFPPHSEGHKVDKRCPGKVGKAGFEKGNKPQVMTNGFLRCDFCWPFRVGITDEMRVPK
jgi:hypothetical protein